MAKKKRLAPTTTSPAKMGEEMAVAQSTSAQSPNVQSAPKHGGVGGSPEPRTAVARTGHQERLGAKFAPQMAMGSPEVLSSAQQTQANVRTLPSAVGNRDFWYKRQYGQVQQ